MRFGVEDSSTQTITSTKAARTRSVTHYKRLAWLMIRSVWHRMQTTIIDPKLACNNPFVSPDAMERKHCQVVTLWACGRVN